MSNHLYYIAPDTDGTRTIWRHNPKRPDYPTAILMWHPRIAELWSLAARGLKERAA